jgi:ATP-dependent Zn protease
LVTEKPPNSLRRTAWHEAGHAVVAWKSGKTVVLVSIAPDRTSKGRSTHLPGFDADSEDDRVRENIIAMGGWAAEKASGEADDGLTYDSADMLWIYAHSSEDHFDVDFGWAEQEAERIVRENLSRVERLAAALMERTELVDADEIKRIIEGLVA